MSSLWAQNPNVWPRSILQNRYKVVYADPPWEVQRDRSSAFERHKKLLNVIDIASLPVRELVDDDAFLAMWWPSNMPLEALEVMKEWGFRLVSMNGFTWVRQLRESSEAELCLFAVRGDGLEFIRDWSVPRIIYGRGKASVSKPAEAQLVLNRLIPAEPKLSLFAEIQHPRWESWKPDFERLN